MPWYAPKVIHADGDPLPADDLNEIGYDLLFLKAVRANSFSAWNITNPTHNTTSFVEISASISRTITPINSGLVQLNFQGRFSGSGAIAFHLDLYKNVNGGAFSSQTQANIWSEQSIPSGEFRILSLSWMWSGLTLNVPHVIRPMWKMVTGTSVTLAGAQGFISVVEL